MFIVFVYYFLLKSTCAIQYENIIIIQFCDNNVGKQYDTQLCKTNLLQQCMATHL